MTNTERRVRLHDVTITGDVADRAALLAAIERAVQSTIGDRAPQDVPTTEAVIRNALGAAGRG